ncbi:MAG: hypothetical protein ACFFCW_20365 [Candidatus Hodarchaeota archaeon]
MQKQFNKLVYLLMMISIILYSSLVLLAQEKNRSLFKKTNKVQSKFSKACGGGCGAASKTINRKSMQRKVLFHARISYPYAESSDLSGGNTLELIPLTKPKNQHNDGVYIWKKENGNYVLSWFNVNTIDISGTITSDSEIYVYKVSDMGVVETINIMNVLSFSDILVEDLKSIEFKPTVGEVDIDIKINGVHNSNRIYIGAHKQNPADVPFRLEQNFNLQDAETMMRHIQPKSNSVNGNTNSTQSSTPLGGVSGGSVGAKKE